MDQNKRSNQDKKNDHRVANWIIIGVVIMMIMSFANYYMSSELTESRTEEITYNQFLEWLEAGEVREVLVTTDGTIELMRTDEDATLGITYYTGTMDDPELTERLTEAGVDFKQEIAESSNALVTILLYYILPLVIIYLIFFFLFRSMSKGGNGVMGVGKSNAKVYVQKQTGVTFKDVAGQEEAKESLREIVDFLHNPGKYTSIGAKLPKGALLVGPPGTGKTLLARAVAGEANVPFYSLTGSDFVEMFVGVGASRVRDLFKQASQSAPCIIFIDELDAIGKSRDSRYGGNDEREQTLNQLLSEMDGFDPSKGIIILGATNRPEILDKALLRPGRFDRRIIVEKPDLNGRIETLKVHSRNVRMDETVDFREIALATSGAVGSDLANIVNEAALNAVKNGRNAVSQQDLFESVEVVIAGKEKKDRVLSEKERKIVSYHEVGHALCAALQKNTEPVQKITIVPRTMGALGYTMQMPEEEKYLMSKKEIEEELVVLYGGRAAEELRFDSVTTGASNDIERATNLARSMVTQYGMSDKFGLMGLESVESQYLDGHKVLNCGEATAGQIDEEVMKILRVAYDQALTLLRGNLDALDRISAYLIQHETITGKEFMQIFDEVKADRVKEQTANKLEDLSEASETKEITDTVKESEHQTEPADEMKTMSPEKQEHQTSKELTGTMEQMKQATDGTVADTVAKADQTERPVAKADGSMDASPSSDAGVGAGESAEAVRSEQTEHPVVKADGSTDASAEDSIMPRRSIRTIADAAESDSIMPRRSRVSGSGSTAAESDGQTDEGIMPRRSRVLGSKDTEDAAGAQSKSTEDVAGAQCKSAVDAQGQGSVFAQEDSQKQENASAGIHSEDGQKQDSSNPSDPSAEE